MTSKEIVDTFRKTKKVYDNKQENLVKPLCIFGEFCNQHNIEENDFYFPYGIILDLEIDDEYITVNFLEDGSECYEYVSIDLVDKWLNNKENFLAAYEKKLKDSEIKSLKSEITRAQEAIKKCENKLKKLESNE